MEEYIFPDKDSSLLPAIRDIIDGGDDILWWLGAISFTQEKAPTIGFEILSYFTGKGEALRGIEAELA
ncbi:S-adenosyl-L-methionine-dependent methyltransferase [Penicillium chermesinum]|uniref:S-adenosyl-L-methionine-dependent methyltransferase n=1 Tax=Penicillium chermesinum TaxID=63820 RepID=A0A9W9TCA8_9EURO|nr:S-adenosyl-L-methionine-dependent methyltransferase [Penicillium chermesinum]KAJ5217266.1 S-adenosyl-L-methionine-dependent methyltransferase [Penicillium chermesinum]